MASNPPTQPSPNAGTLMGNAELYAMVDGINYLTGAPRSGQPQRPFTVVEQTVAQSIPNNTNTAVLFDTEDADTDGGHSTTTNSARYTAQTAGWYEVAGTVVFAANSTGVRQAYLQVNGTGASYGETTINAPGSFEAAVPAADTIHLDVGDYVHLKCYQNSGGGLNTGTSRHGSRLRVKWIGP